jgi:soluble lytic murein transglycosylase-like protein
MKQTILLISLLAFISTQSMWYDKLTYKQPIKQPIPIDTLLNAVMAVESNFDTMAYNSKENAAGVLQIRPIMVREVNRLLGEDKYTLKNRWNKAKSIEMFNVIRLHLKGASDEEIARTWNGGYNGKNNPKTLGYWKKVRKQFKNNFKNDNHN